MSQAEDLLNTLTTSVDVTRLADASTEPHIIIDENRVVTVPDALKRLAVQYDHNVETVTFDCPRYWDEHDMSEMVIYINYLRSDKETGTYRATDVIVDSENPALMHFNWTVSRNVTEAYGQIVFLVCIKKADADGNERNHWNSELCKTCTVSEGLEVNGEALRELYPDIIDQWYNEVLGVIDEVNTVKQGLINMRDSGELDGATFTPSVSSTGDLSWTNDRGRENPETVNVRGPGGVSPKITVTNIQGGHRITITDVNGTQYVDVKDTIIDPTEAAKELIDDLFIVSTVEPKTGPVLWFETVEDAHWSETIEQPAPIWAQIQATIGNLKDLDTTAKNNLVAAVNEVMAKGGEALDNRIKKFYTGNLGAVNIADSDDGAVRNLVIGGRSEQFTTTGANILPYPYHDTTATVNGVTFTDNGDGSITMNGTATANAEFAFLADDKPGFMEGMVANHPGEKVTFKGLGNGAGSESYFVFAQGFVNNTYVYGSDVTSVVLSEIVYVRQMFVRVLAGATVDNVTIKPMIALGETIAAYEPFTGGAPSPSPDYPQEIKSVNNPTVRVCGKNLYDANSYPLTFNRAINTETGKDYETPSNIWCATLDYIPFAEYAGKKVSYTTSTTISAYDKDRNFIRQVLSGNRILPDNTAYIRFDVKYEYSSVMQIELGNELTGYNPYKEQTAPVPVTLRGIGDVRDELYVYADGSGKLVQRVAVLKMADALVATESFQAVGANYRVWIDFNKSDRPAGYTLSKKKDLCTFLPCDANYTRDYPHFYFDGGGLFLFSPASTKDELISNFGTQRLIYMLETPIETALTAEQVKALFDLRTYYGGTNVSFQSENGVEPVVNFDYACALENFVEYIKAAQGDDRKFIYDMDERMTDAEYVAALAYVNSEYATALTELEV